jgi:hypothetical protein
LPGLFRIRGILPDLGLDLLQLGFIGRHFHCNIRAVDGERADLVGKFLNPGLGPFRIRKDPVDPFEVYLLVFFEPGNRLLRKLDPALCLFKIGNKLQVIRPAFLLMSSSTSARSALR